LKQKELKMAEKERKSPNARPEILNLPLVTSARPKRGRPRKTAADLPPMELRLSDAERARYELFVNYLVSEVPNLTPFDLLLLEACALEYIKYLRWLANEIDTGEVASMSRHHPGVQMRENLRMLSIWRKDRAADKKADAEVDKIVQFFTGSPRT
jgi:hypothetical protein